MHPTIHLIGEGVPMVTFKHSSSSVEKRFSSFLELLLFRNDIVASYFIKKKSRNIDMHFSSLESSSSCSRVVRLGSRGQASSCQGKRVHYERITVGARTGIFACLFS